MKKREIGLTVSEILGDSGGWKKEAAEIFAGRLQELLKEYLSGTDETGPGLDELIAALKRERERSRHWEP